MKSFILVCLFYLSVTLDCHEQNDQSTVNDLVSDSWTSIQLSEPKGPSEIMADTNLIQTQALEDVDPRYVGCGLGNFWCTKLRDAGVPASAAALLSFQPDSSQPNEWFYNGAPTCVAHGEHYEKCSVDNVLICSGGDEFGYAEAQVQDIYLALNNSGIHPKCPGCAIGRKTPNSPTICLVSKGSSCEFTCFDNYLPVGKRVCNENGTIEGGECKVKTVDVEITELADPSASPSPSPIPSVEYKVTAQNITHENWTEYQQELDSRLDIRYKERIASNACLYLWDLENYFHDVIHLLPSKPLRANLQIAARAAKCAWLHDEIFDESEQQYHRIPIRGDHGPWRFNYYPNVVHVKLDGIRDLSINIDVKNSTGLDLYKAVGKRMSVNPDSITLYAPNSQRPIDYEDSIAAMNIKFEDIVKMEMGRKFRIDSKKRTWGRGLTPDVERGPIAP